MLFKGWNIKNFLVRDFCNYNEFTFAFLFYLGIYARTPLVLRFKSLRSACADIAGVCHCVKVSAFACDRHDVAADGADFYVIAELL